MPADPRSSRDAPLLARRRPSRWRPSSGVRQRRRSGARARARQRADDPDADAGRRGARRAGRRRAAGRRRRAARPGRAAPHAHRGARRRPRRPRRAPGAGDAAAAAPHASGGCRRSWSTPSMAAESGALARLLASMSAAVSQQPGGAVSDVEALQTTLAAEHAAVYVFGALGGRTSQSANPELFDAISAAYAAHRARRDELTAAITDLGAEPVAARGGVRRAGRPGRGPSGSPGSRARRSSRARRRTPGWSRTPSTRCAGGRSRR